MTSSPTTLTTTDLEALFKSAGLEIPPDLRAGTLAEALALKQITALLRGPRSQAAEPSNIFSLVPRLRQ